MTELLDSFDRNKPILFNNKWRYYLLLLTVIPSCYIVYLVLPSVIGIEYHIFIFLITTYSSYKRFNTFNFIFRQRDAFIFMTILLSVIITLSSAIIANLVAQELMKFISFDSNYYIIIEYLLIGILHAIASISMIEIIILIYKQLKKHSTTKS